MHLSVDADASDIPECARDPVATGVDSVDAGAHAAGVRVAGPVTAEGEIDDEHVWSELVIERALLAVEESTWLAPGVRVHASHVIADLLRDRAIVAAPEPDWKEVSKATGETS